MSDLEFAKPEYLHLIWLVALIAFGLVALEYVYGNSLGRFLSKEMQHRLARTNSFAARILGIIFFSCALVCFVIALMRPQYGFTEKKLPHVGAQIMVCLDVSKSMLAEDATPNRLDRAKSELEVLLNYLREDQVGLIAFAGKSTVLSPMTTDFGYLKLLLREATPTSVGRGGTMLEEPIRRAMNGFSDASDMSRVIILITDGEDNGSKPLDAAKLAAERGVKIITIGFGDERGTRIQITDPKTELTDYVRDQLGRPVESRLDVSTLTKIANETDGAYIPAGVGSLDFESIHADHIEPLMRAQSETKRIVKNEAFQWPLIGGVILISLSIVTSNSLTFSRQSFPAWLEEKANDANVTPFGGHRSIKSSDKRPIPAGKKNSNSTIASLFGLVLFFASTLLSSSCLGKQVSPPRPRLTSTPQSSAPADQATIDRQANAPRMGKGESEEGIGSEISSSRSAEKAIPSSAINCYNRALPILNSDSAYAETLLEEARRNASKDGELRFRSAYNLGWVKIYQAQAVLKTKPEDALRNFEAAASWFREAIRIRPRNDDSRHNLEIVMRRITELADSLRKQEESDFAENLDQLMQRQSQILDETRQLLERVSQAGNMINPDTDVQDDFKKSFRLLSVDQRLLNSDLQDLTFKALEEVDAFQKEQTNKTATASPNNSSAAGSQNPTTQLSPQEQQKQLRIAQLSRAVLYTERAVQRLGQARSQMRFRNGERAARRAALGLDELNRARDQLREPAEVIRRIMAEMRLLNQQTSAFQAGKNIFAAFLGKQVENPKWLDLEYLKQFQQTQLERTEELASVLESVLPNDTSTKSLEKNAGAGSTASSNSNQIKRIAEAANYVKAAVSDFVAASSFMDASKLPSTMESQTDGIKNLAEAYERFADLKGLIELTHGDQTQLTKDIDLSKNLTNELRREVIGRMLMQQNKNIARFNRIITMVEEDFTAESAVANQAKQNPAQSNPAGNPAEGQKSPELQQLEQAKRLLPDIEERLKAIVSGLNKNLEVAAESTKDKSDLDKSEERQKNSKSKKSDIDAASSENENSQWDEVVGDSKLVMEKLNELRRIFFSIQELLRETAQRQQTLNGETQKASKRFQTAREKIEADKGLDQKQMDERITSAKSTELGPLGSRQSQLEFVASEVQTTLGKQAEQAEKQVATSPTNASTDEEEQLKNQKEIAEKLKRATDLVAEAKAKMKIAISEFASTNKTTEQMTDAQTIAFQKLVEALQQLTPPNSNQNQQNQSQGQSSSDKSDGGGDDQKEDGDSPMKAIQQGIRDREAKRRLQNQLKFRQNRVEKDW